MIKVIVFLPLVFVSALAVSQQLYLPGASGSSTNGNIGMGSGNNNPLGKLDIKHAGGQLRLSGGAVAGGLWTSTTDMLYLADWDTALKGLNINMTTGSVGIGGTGTPYSKMYLVDARTKATPLILAGSHNTGSNAFHHNFLSFAATGYISNDILSETYGEFAKNWHIGIASHTQYFNYSNFSIYNKGMRRFMIDENGNVGIGTVNGPAYRLEVHSTNATNFRLVSNNSTPSTPSIDVYDAANGTEFVLSPSVGKVDLFTYSGHSLALGTANTEKMRILPNGNVGIGTVDPDSKLAVKGIIHTQEVRVDLTGAVTPDYVFEKDYNLLPLSELETYINANKHLPEVPSANEMERDGMNLKEMNLILLKKVEELTLHLIEQKKTDEKSQNVIDKLEKKINLLEKQVADLQEGKLK